MKLKRTRRRTRVGGVGLVLVLLPLAFEIPGMPPVSALVLFPGGFLGILCCVIGLFGRPRRRAAVGLAVGLCLFTFFGLRVSRFVSGRLIARDYPLLRADLGSRASHMPPALPLGANGVRIVANGVYSIFPAPDYYVEVRLVIPIADAERLLHEAAAAAISPDLTTANCDFKSAVDGLLTADDQNPQTPLPPPFRSYLLSNPSGMNVGGVSVNCSTGEVVYWLFES